MSQLTCLASPGRALPTGKVPTSLRYVLPFGSVVCLIHFRERYLLLRNTNLYALEPDWRLPRCQFGNELPTFERLASVIYQETGISIHQNELRMPVRTLTRYASQTHEAFELRLFGPSPPLVRTNPGIDHVWVTPRQACSILPLEYDTACMLRSLMPAS